MTLSLIHIYRRVVSGKFYDGLHTVAFSSKDVEVYCHTRQHLYGGDDRFFFDVCDHHIAGSIYVVEIHIVPCICKHSND